MGVKCLWDILQDAKIEQHLSDIKGQTIAVDLATWICEAENVKKLKSNVKKPYLRNLVYRVVGLTRQRINLVFVTDGIAPELKRATIAKRLAAREGTHQTSPVKTVARNQLNFKFKECCDLLDALGIVWMKADGEAEATCAALNMHGYVDACATNDGDAFLYGAHKVYRNLNYKKGSVIECYEMKTIKDKLDLSRNSLISLGLLLGCDYVPEGVRDVGKVTALTWLKSLKQNENPLQEMKRWKDYQVPSTESTQTKKPTHCTNCKHIGSKRDHCSSGCKVCHFHCKNEALSSLPCSCDWHEDEKRRKELSIITSLIKKSQEVTNFPNQCIIDEFLQPLDISEPCKASVPRIDDVTELLRSELGWSGGYAFEKVFPVFTCYVLLNPHHETNLYIKRIVRAKKRDFVAMYEVEWSFPPHDDWVTIEPQDLVKQRFPEAVTSYVERIEAEKQAKKVQKKSKGKKATMKNSKVTDNFKTKKPHRPFDEKKQIVKKESAEGVEELNSCKSSNSILPEDSFEIPKNGLGFVETMPSCDNKNEDRCQNSTRQLEEAAAAVKHLEITRCTQTPTEDVSFGLNFSLGQSIVKSPVLLPAEKEPDQTVSENEENFPDSPKSPIYLSLSERIRLKCTSN